MDVNVVQLPTVEALAEEMRGVVFERQTLRTRNAWFASVG